MAFGELLEVSAKHTAGLWLLRCYQPSTGLLSARCRVLLLLLLVHSLVLLHAYFGQASIFVLQLQLGLEDGVTPSMNLRGLRPDVMFPFS